MNRSDGLRLASCNKVDAPKRALPTSGNRHLAAVSVNILENTVLSIEWAHDRDYAIGHSSIDVDGNVISGIGASANTFTTQRAIEF